MIRKFIKRGSNWWVEIKEENGKMFERSHEIENWSDITHYYPTWNAIEIQCKRLNAVEVTNQLVYKSENKVASQAIKHKCTCDWSVVYQSGCKCGGL